MLFGKPVPTPHQVRGRLFPDHALAARRQRALDDGLGRDGRVGRLRGEFADQAIGIGGHGVGRLQHQPLQPPAVGRNPPLQALLHPLHDQRVFLHPGDRIGFFARRQFGNMGERGVALAVELEGGLEPKA